jgi:acetyl esterase/lipase
MPFAAHRRTAVAVLASLGFLAAMPASAQMQPDIAEKIAALGRVVDPEKTGTIYAPLQEKEPYAGLKVLRDVKYGSDVRNVVDIFAAEAANGTRPVLMFVHGGAYTRGDKRPPGSPFYDNVMVWAARNGMVGVNVEYRLAPQFPWPAGAEDLVGAVRWVADNIAAHGGDPGRIFLVGHSAGATHVATYVSHPEFHGPKGSGLAGAMFSSGVFDLTKAGTARRAPPISAATARSTASARPCRAFSRPTSHS